MTVRLIGALAAAVLLAGCSTEEGLHAQELLQQAEVAQAALSSSTFEGSMSFAIDGMNVQMLFDGATSKDGEWVSLRTSGVPDGGDVAMQILVRGGRVWMNMGGRWESMPAPAGVASNGTMIGGAFQGLAQYVKGVRVTEHQLIGGKPVTMIAGDVDAEGMFEAFAKLGSVAEGASFDLGKSGLEIGDIHAVLTIDERTRLLDTAFITFAMSAKGKSAEIELRYRLATANEPVELPSPNR